jgi:hypothetical protein
MWGNLGTSQVSCVNTNRMVGGVFLVASFGVREGSLPIDI